MKYLKDFKLYESKSSKITSEERDEIANKLIKIIDKESNDDKSEGRKLLTLISTIHLYKSKDNLKELVNKDNEKDINNFIDKVLPIIKDIQVTRFKQIFKQIRSYTSNRKK
jgi:hypothetical protein